jgi:hypothetical protein
MANIKPETEQERAQREHEELGEILETQHDMDATPEPVTKPVAKSVVKAPKQIKKKKKA